MSKISLTNLVNLQNETTAVNAINANNAALTTALDNTVSRDGTSPNTMGASLDMNSNRVINLPSAISTTEPVTLSQMTSALVAHGSIATGVTGVTVSAAMQPVVAASTIAQANFLLGNGTTPTNTYTPQQYDILAGTALHDSTAAINAAITACPAGGTVRLPATSSGYLVSSGFAITKSINIEGDGPGTFFTGNVSTSTDLFNVTVPGASIIRGISFKNFKIQIIGCRNWFMLDTTALGAYLAEVEISGIFTLDVAPGGRSCIYVKSTNVATSGVFDLIFAQNQFNINNTGFACIEFENAGDTIRVRDSLLTGVGFAVLGTQVVGATNLVIDGNNCTCTGGVSLQNCFKPVIRDFEIEFAGAVLTGAGIILNGCTEGNIGPGNITILGTSTGFAEAIFLTGSSNICIDGCTLSSAVSGIGLNITNTCTTTRLGIGNTYAGFGNDILNNGITTRTASYT